MIKQDVILWLFLAYSLRAEVFGVRWGIGTAFTYNSLSSQGLVLQFESDSPILSPVFLNIRNYMFSCGVSNGVSYKCRTHSEVMESTIDPLPYSISTNEVVFQNEATGNQSIKQFRINQLFSSSLHLPLPASKILLLNNLALESPCTLSIKAINLIILLDDKPDLRKLHPLSSRTVTIPAQPQPQLFHTPFWELFSTKLYSLTVPPLQFVNFNSGLTPSALKLDNKLFTVSITNTLSVFRQSNIQIFVQPSHYGRETNSNTVYEQGGTPIVSNTNDEGKSNQTQLPSINFKQPGLSTITVVLDKGVVYSHYILSECSIVDSFSILHNDSQPFITLKIVAAIFFAIIAVLIFYLIRVICRGRNKNQLHEEKQQPRSTELVSS